MSIFDMFKPKWQNDNSHIRIEAVKKLTDQSTIANVAMNTEHRDVCIEATNKLTDQILIANVAMNVQYPDIGMAAFNKLTDQSLIANVARNARDPDINMAAFNKLTDQSLIAEFAKAEFKDLTKKRTGWELYDTSFHLAAAKKLTDQSIIADVAMNASWENVCFEAVKKLTDQSLIADVAKRARWGEICEEALIKLTDQSLIVDVAKNTEYWTVEEIATKKLKRMSKRILNAEILIFRSVDIVWDYFTTCSYWEEWYGGSLLRVDPEWEYGASLIWELGAPSQIVSIEKGRYLVTKGRNTKTFFRFTDLGNECTLAEMGLDFVNDIVFTDDGRGELEQMEMSLRVLRVRVEEK